MQPRQGKPVRMKQDVMNIALGGRRRHYGAYHAPSPSRAIRFRRIECQKAACQLGHLAPEAQMVPKPNVITEHNELKKARHEAKRKIRVERPIECSTGLQREWTLSPEALAPHERVGLPSYQALPLLTHQASGPTDLGRRKLDQVAGNQMHHLWG